MRHATNRRRRSSRGGFTLLEVMLAMSILAFGLLGLAAMQLHAMKGRASGRHTTFAAAVAQTQMDELQRRRWTTVTDTGGAWVSQAADETVPDGSGRVEQAYTVSYRVTDEVANVTRLIDVQVTWDEPDRPNRAYTISSIRFNREGL